MAYASRIRLRAGRSTVHRRIDEKQSGAAGDGKNALGLLTGSPDGGGRMVPFVSEIDTPKARASVGLLLIDDRGWILLQLRDGNGIYPYHWATVGGAVDERETLEAAIHRAVAEGSVYTVSSVLR